MFKENHACLPCPLPKEHQCLHVKTSRQKQCSVSLHIIVHRYSDFNALEYQTQQVLHQQFSALGYKPNLVLDHTSFYYVLGQYPHSLQRN